MKAKKKESRKAADLGRIWWDSGVKAAKVHMPNCVEDKWEEIPDGDKAFMQAAAEAFVAALEAPKPPRKSRTP